jgi:hypothetical protein
MELDYKELQAVADVGKQLKQSRYVRDGDYRVFTVVPFMSLPWLIMNHALSRSYTSIVITCLVVLAFIYSLKEMHDKRRHTKQLSLLLGIAHRALDSDPVNRQKLNELQTLKSGN